MNEVSTSVGVDHPRGLSVRRLVTVLAVGMLCGASSVYAQVTPSAPHAVATAAAPIKSPKQASAAVPERQRAGGANAMGLLLGVLLMPRHGT